MPRGNTKVFHYSHSKTPTDSTRPRRTLTADLGKNYAPADATEAVKALYEDRRTHVLGKPPHERSFGAALDHD
jgi:hypothetical protein